MSRPFGLEYKMASELVAKIRAAASDADAQEIAATTLHEYGRDEFKRGLCEKEKKKKGRRR